MSIDPHPSLTHSLFNNLNAHEFARIHAGGKCNCQADIARVAEILFRQDVGMGEMSRFEGRISLSYDHYYSLSLSTQVSRLVNILVLIPFSCHLFGYTLSE